MLPTKDGYPVPYHPTWEILDSSKLQDYLTCPRLFFFRYVLGWDGEELNNHLIFGEAWHAAQEVLLLQGYTEDGILAAYRAFEDVYRRDLPEATDAALYPKTPARALDALINYVMFWREADMKQVPLHTEIAGTVPIMDGVLLHFRMDSIIQKDGLIFSREHKTGSRLDRAWQGQWTLKVQVGTYTHVLYCLYPPDEVDGVVINGAIFNKTKTQFVRIPIRKDPRAMQTWWWNVKDWTKRLLIDYERLHSCSRNDQTLMAFTMNTESCTKYFGCPFMDYCSAWPNPLQYTESPPVGFTTRWWDPSARPAKVVLALESA